MEPAIEIGACQARSDERGGPEPPPGDEGQRPAAAPSDELMVDEDRADSPMNEIGRRGLRNIVILVALGAALWLWVLYYTDWIPFTGGLLGLGGLVAWVSLVGRLLTDKQRGTLRGALAHLLLEKPRTLVYGLISSMGVLLLASFGSIEIRSFEESRNRTVSVLSSNKVTASKKPVGAEEESRARHGRYLAAHSTRRFPVWAFWLGRDFTIKVDGLPARRFRIHGLQKRTLTVPDAFFRRPIVLIRPDIQMSANAERATPPLSLRVCRNDQLLGHVDGSNYRGQTVWVGCHADVEIPSRVREYWRLEAVKLGLHPEVLTRWTAPLAVGADTELVARDRLEATLFKDDGIPYAAGELQIQQIQSGGDFVQELQLHYVDEGKVGEFVKSCHKR